MKKENPTKPSSDKRAMFADKAISILESAADKALEEIPELRGAIVIFDWHETLNKVAPLGIWRDERGEVSTARLDTLCGGTAQLVEMLQQQVTVLAAGASSLMDFTRKKKDEAENAAEAPQEVADERDSPVGRADGRHSDSYDPGDEYGPAADNHRAAQEEAEMQEGEKELRRLQDAKGPSEEEKSRNAEAGEAAREDQNNPATAPPVPDPLH